MAIALQFWFLILVTAGIGIPLRCYLISAASFDYRRLGEKFQKMFLFILVLDLSLGGIAPVNRYKIGFGTALPPRRLFFTYLFPREH